MQVGTLHSYSGNLVPGVFYYAVGPTWHMPTPFTVTLYNNATISNDRPTVYFNYTITSATGTVISGSYDKVEFNSAAHPTHRAAPATFQVNGKQYNAFGLLNDAEIMLGGPGGGSTTSLFGLNATMGLWTLANGSSTYAPVPAASSFGTDTGETSEGIAEWTNGGASPIAYLGVGPSLLQPLWGLVGAASGHITASFALSPSNAFAFANQGHAFTVNTAQWAPTPAHGAATYWLSPHTYTFEFLLADHNAQTVTVSGSGSVTVHLSANASVGIDTPLWAWDAGQLAAISSGGTGTIHDPFTLDNNGPGLVSPLFGEFNDYYYPVFPGVFLANTNVYVTASALPVRDPVHEQPRPAILQRHPHRARSLASDRLDVLPGLVHLEPAVLEHQRQPDRGERLPGPEHRCDALRRYGELALGERVHAGDDHRREPGRGALLRGPAGPRRVQHR
jgi:thermopsin